MYKEHEHRTLKESLGMSVWIVGYLNNDLHSIECTLYSVDWQTIHIY